MNFTIECPVCKESYNLNYKDVIEKPSSFKCMICGTIPSPDIMTAYQSIGKTMAELYDYCEHDDKKNYCLKAIKKS